jgi:hypothetical protein
MFNKIRIAAMVNAFFKVAFNNFHNITKTIQATINVAIIIYKSLNNSPYLRGCYSERVILSELKITSAKAIRPNLDIDTKAKIFYLTVPMLYYLKMRQ